MNPDLSEIRISKTELAAGAFKLAGRGTIQRQKDNARLGLDMSGSIPCSELGASAAQAHFPGLVGDLITGAARMGVSGSVKIGVKVDADTRDLAAARVDQGVAYACTLR